MRRCILRIASCRHHSCQSTQHILPPRPASARRRPRPVPLHPRPQHPLPIHPPPRHHSRTYPSFTEAAVLAWEEESTSSWEGEGRGPGALRGGKDVTDGVPQWKSKPKRTKLAEGAQIPPPLELEEEDAHGPPCHGRSQSVDEGGAALKEADTRGGARPFPSCDAASSTRPTAMSPSPPPAPATLLLLNHNHHPTPIRPATLVLPRSH